jgi:hypothetical protein
MNPYEQMDNEGRDIVTSLFNNKMHLVAGEASDRYDLSGSTISDGDFYIEVKYRPEVSSTNFNTDMLEYKKMDALRNIDRNATHFYFMIFNDDVARCHNLKKISIMDVRIDNRNCPVASAENKGYENKLVIDLPAKNARVYKWK